MNPTSTHLHQQQAHYKQPTTSITQSSSKGHQDEPKLTFKRPSSNNKGLVKARYLGVRQRPSGRWVAEIKDTSQKLRLWLGTFDKAEEAAAAYDSAARVLRGRNAKTNFPSTHGSVISSCTHEERKNPRLFHLLQHAVLKNQARSRSLMIDPWTCPTIFNKGYHEDERGSIITGSVLGFGNTLVEETIVCSSSSVLGDANSDASYYNSASSSSCKNSSKVHSSIVVAPSFSSCSDGEQEKRESRCNGGVVICQEYPQSADHHNHHQ